MELNYDVTVVNGHGGFKHAPIPALFEGRDWIPPSDPILGMVKDPWAWLVSMWRYVNGVGAQHVRCGATWPEFLRSPIAVFFGGLDRFPGQRFASPAEYWNAMSYNLVSVGSRAQIVRYEDLLNDPRGTCVRIEEALGLTRQSDDFVSVPRRTMNMADRERFDLDEYTTQQLFDAEYYRQRRYHAEFGILDRRLVRSQLDENLLTELRY